jgi:hypothetical protein
MSVPEILIPLIPEILARLRTTKSVRKLPMRRLCRKWREEDVGDAETTRSRDFAEGWSCEDRGSALELAPLRQNPVSEEIIRPLSELLVTDILVGTERARSIATFRLGVAIRGRRSLALAWETPRRYSNEPVTVRSIKGHVSI